LTTKSNAAHTRTPYPILAAFGKAGSWIKEISTLAAIPILLVALSEVGNVYLQRTAYVYLLFLTMSQAWNIIMLSGRVNLGQFIFYATGGYALALLLNLGIPLVLCVLAGGFFALALALLCSPLLRLRGIFFAIITLFLPMLFRAFVLLTPTITGGASGVFQSVKPHPFIMDYYMMLAIAVLATGLNLFLAHSKYRLALDAMHDDEDVALAMGVNVLGSRMLCFSISAFISGVAGALYTYSLPYVDTSFLLSTEDNILMITMSTIGGIRDVWGPVVGALLSFLFEYARIAFPYVHLIISGIILIAATLFVPGGIMHYLRKLQTK